MIKKPFRLLMKCFFVIICLASICVFSSFSFMFGYKITLRNHGNVYVTEVCKFSESTKELRNPNRGFYSIYGFLISDEKDEDYNNLLSQNFVSSEQNSLVMIQINLQEYAAGIISPKGLQNIDKLFYAMSQFDKQYLIRFLYDWNGENRDVEPPNVEIILGHMQQLEGIFQEYNDIIFVHQGLFIGNWGELNGTEHIGSIKDLAVKLLEVTGYKIYLSVRTPAQWRNITQMSEPNISGYAIEHISQRIGLFNDGIMGNYSDCGSYGEQSKYKVGDFTCWNRTEELNFQEELCKYVPNGGEVIIDNEYNDFPNAIKSLNQMHITYLNRDYDQAVLEKWKQYIINDDTIYNGMDGWTYIERHLGYRLLINDVDLGYKPKEDVLKVKIDLQNVGFAPVYKSTELSLHFVNTETKNTYSYAVEADIHKLTGGNNANAILSIVYEQNLVGFNEGSYEVYFLIKDNDSGLPIYLANEQEYEDFGYKLGKIYIENLRASVRKIFKK